VFIFILKKPLHCLAITIFAWQNGVL